MYDGATHVYPCTGVKHAISRSLVEEGDTVVVEGRLICSEATETTWKTELEMINIFLIEKGESRSLLLRMATNV